MPNTSPTPKRMARNSALFLLSALLGAAMVVACDGRVERTAAADTSENAAANGNGSSGRGAPMQVAPAPQASEAQPRPTLVTPPREAISDTMITARIQAALLGDPGMTGADVSVHTDGGVVVLTGTVRNHEQTGLASAHAQRQEGVMRVDNQLSVPLQ